MSTKDEILSMSPEELAVLEKKLAKKLVTRIAVRVAISASVILVVAAVQRKLDSNKETED